jgi:hypothetical protein
MRTSFYAVVCVPHPRLDRTVVVDVQQLVGHSLSQMMHDNFTLLTKVHFETFQVHLKNC